MLAGTVRASVSGNTGVCRGRGKPCRAERHGHAARPPELLRRAAVAVFEADDVVLAQIRTRLYFDQFERDLAGVAQASMRVIRGNDWRGDPRYFIRSLDRLRDKGLLAHQLQVLLWDSRHSRLPLPPHWMIGWRLMWECRDRSIGRRRRYPGRTNFRRAWA